MIREASRELKRTTPVRATIRLLRRARDYAQLPPSVKAAQRRDRVDDAQRDPGCDWAIAEGVDWLCRAQDNSATRDGGVARHYGLIGGWGASYPETTGYIVPTMLQQAWRLNRPDLRDRARRMLDWLVSIQLPGGGFQGGTVNETPVVPVTFNTGQILLGLAAGVSAFGAEYLPAMVSAADWLVDVQDADGSWRSHPTPFSEPGERVYETHVAWGLIAAAKIDNTRGYAEGAARNVMWALTHQHTNGWFDRCGLGDSRDPLTHTIGYTLRGLIEVYRFVSERAFLDAACRTADGLVAAQRHDGSLPGKLDANWQATVRWSCLTGNVQIAHSLLILHELTGRSDYYEAAVALNRFVRSCARPDDPDETRGAVKGSFPINGDYGRFEYLNWATKFAIDSYTVESELGSRRIDPIGR